MLAAAARPPASAEEAQEEAPANAAPAVAEDAASKSAPAATTDARESVCLMVESAARAHDLPLDFFARIIWQESRFQPQAVGPRTRSGQRAEGIAQFMPGTAAERRLLDPFDPVQALPKSAEFLRELRNQFGNLGLAAAAYNAGPQRVRDFLSGARPLPPETRHYVLAVTGTSADDWAKGADKGGDKSGGAAAGRREGKRTDCRTLIAMLRQAPNLFVERLEQRVKTVAASPWGVQLSAGFSRDAALSAYGRLAKRYSGVLSGHDPSLLSSVLRSRGTRPFYQVRIGAETRQRADELCGRIRGAGGACLVLRNHGTG